MSQNRAVVVNMASEDCANKKESKQLFGPDIGVVSTAPAWTHSVGKKAAADSLSADIIKSWIAKSKETSQPTTTLQALVNLKRPTLRLVPLTIAPGDDPDQVDSHHHHGLEFEYDCDAPKCGIYVNVILPAEHPLAENADSGGFSCTPVFQSIVEGGFGRFLRLKDSATLELGRFEQSVRPEDAVSEKPPANEQATSPAAATPRNGRPRRRFTAFHFRKRSSDRAASGPALAVVDADSAGTAPESEKGRASGDDMREGVRVTIHLSALDENGMDVPTVNEQTTYLHIVRMGTPPTGDEEDARPWIVKVVKREATIGPYTFHLHEIYGLAAQSSIQSETHPHTSSPTSTDAHTYPPATPITPATVHEDEPSSECLLCLSSPREVILLPCRHLVACKECAIKMVEFGAGGNIIHNEDSNTTGRAVANATTGEGGSSAANTNGATEGSHPPVPPPNQRRKRKAKGWFCPICRQPYTSLLRISTMPPTKDISDDENRRSTSIDDPENEREGADNATNAPGLVPATSDPLTTPTSMISTLRSGLRNLTLGNTTRQESDSLPRDVERGLATEPIAT